MSSTSAIMGTGLKKCMPMKRCGRLVPAAELRDGNRRCVRRQDRIGLRVLVGLLQDPDLERFVLGCRLDDEVARLERCVIRRAVDACECGASLSAADSFSFLTRRSRLDDTALRPRATAASSTSIIVTASPATAQACAMLPPTVAGANHADRFGTPHLGMSFR